MKTITHRLISTIAAGLGCAAFLLAGTAPAAVITWSGTSGGDIGWPTNWTGGVLPSAATPDTAQWNNTPTGALSLAFNTNSLAGAAGNAGINLNMTALNTGSLSIDSGATNISSLRLGNITNAVGSGGLTLGDGANTFNITLGGAASTQTWQNDSANPATINSDVVIGLGGAAAHTLLLQGAGNWTFNNALANGGGTLTLTKAGAGTLTLNGAATYTGVTTVNQGVLVTSGGMSGTASPFKVANVAAQAAAVYQTAGTLAIPGQLQVGSIAGAWGYYNLSGGTINVANGGELDPGGTSAGSGTFGQFDMTGGTLNIGASGTGPTYLLPNRAGAANMSSVVNFLGGTTTIFGSMTDAQFAGYEANWNAGGQTNTTTIGGNATFSSVSVGVKMNYANNAANIASLNLNGGTFQVLGFSANQNAGAVLNFNGGTLKAGNAATGTGNNLANDGNFLANIASVFVYTNGATFDDNGKTVVIAQPLLAPSGNGVSAIAVSAGGSGYAVPPLVIISGGGGSGATAYAQVNRTGGVTNIVVTCPGTGYTSTPAVTLGNNGGSSATIGTITMTPNASGGLTKLGAGTLVLTGPNTYTNTTFVNAGRLALTGTQPGTGPVVVSDGAKFGVALTGAMSPSALTVGTNTGATLEFSVNSTSQAPLTPGTLVMSNATINIVAGNFVAGSSYPLITYTTLGSGSTYISGTLPSGVTGTITTTGNTISLNVTAVTNTVWTGLVNGVWDINTTANWTNAGTAGTKYIDGSVVQFDDTGITNIVSGATLTPGAVLVTNTAKNYTLKAMIAGTGGLTKSGTGSLTNTAANTYTGPTIINQGAFVVSAASSLNIGGPSGANYGPLGDNSAVTLGNSATAVLILTNAANNYSTQIGSLTGGGTTGGNVNLGTATLTVGGDNTSPAAYAGTISGPGSLTKIGTGTLTLSGTNTYTGATAVSAGTVTYSGSAVSSIPGAFKFGNVAGGTGTVNVNGTSSVGFGTAIGYIGYLSGNGVLNVNGGTFANGGEVQVGGSDTSGPGFNGTGILNLSSGAANLSALTIARGNNNQNGVSGSVTVSGGTLTSTNDLVMGFAGTGFGKLAITSSGTVNVGTTATKWLQFGVYDFTSTELDITNGNLNLNINSSIKYGVQNSTGPHTINQISGAVTFYSDFATTVGGTGALDMCLLGTAAATNTYNLNGGTLTVPQIINTVSTGVRNFNFNGGTLRAAKATAAFMTLGTGTAVANVRNGGAIIDNNANGITIVQALTHSAISGDNATDGGVTFNGTAVTTLTGANTYNGGTVVNSGTVQISTESQLGAVPASPMTNITLNGGELYNNNSQPVLNTNRIILLGASGGYFQAGWAPDAFTVNGLITGAGALGINWDGGVIVLNSTNNYQGTTTIGTAFGTWYNNAAANPILRLGVDNALPYGAGASNVIFGTSGLNNTATLDLNGHNVQINGLNGSGANGIINNTNAGSYTVTVGNNNQGGAYAGVIKNTGGTVVLVKTGSGLQTLSGANTYSGNTTINGGTLALGSGGSISNSPNITVAGSATFDVSAISFTLGAAQTLKGTGSVAGVMTTASGSAIYPATGGTAGTMAFNSDLNQNAGGLDYLDINTNYNTGNDQITVAGNLTLSSSDTIHLSALHGSAALDTNSDYVLFACVNTPTMSTTPALVWDGTTPANYLHFSLTLNGNNVVLHYTSTQAPVVTAVANPSTLTRNQLTTITATIIPDFGGISGVTVDVSSIGGSSTAPLYFASSSGVTNYYTNSFAVAPTIGASTNSFTVTVADNSGPPLLGNYVITPVVVVLTNQVWNGVGLDALADDNANWASGAAPGYLGDGMTFAGILNTSPDLDQNYTVSGLIFNTNAGSFTLISSSSYPLTLSGNGPIAVNSTNAQTLNLVVADSGGGLTKSGNGPLVLAAVNTYTGPTTVSAGTLNVSGTVPNHGITTVGSAANNAVLINSGTLTQSNLFVGNVSNAVGAVYQTGGTVTVSGGSGDQTGVGNVYGGYGYYAALGGTLDSVGLAVGGENNTGTGFSGNGGNGIMDVNGGTVNDTGWLVMARGATNETGVLNVFSGALNYAGGGIACNWGSSGQTSIINILGGTVANTVTTGINLNDFGNSTNTAILNLNGGTAQGNFVIGTAGRVNFNGGTLLAYAANAGFMSGLNSVNVYGGGATIEDNGVSITVNQSLQAPTGNGVNGIALYTPGAGYIAPPIVTVVPGIGDTNGVGATAIAQVDISTGNATSGQVTNVLITCPGVNYTATPTFVLSGGGASAPATITGTTPTANASGSFTYNGTSTLTLGGASTYTGNTTITNGGTLELSAPVLHMTFDNISGSTVVNQGSGGSTMNGTLTGTATITSGGRFGNALSIPSGASTAAYVLVSSSVVPLNYNGNWTVGMWIKTTTAGATYLYQGAGAWASGNQTFYLNNGAGSVGSGTHAGGVQNSGGWVGGTAAVNDGNWHFVVVTDNGGTRSSYVDGILDSLTINQWNRADTGTQVRIGGNGTGEADGQVGLGGLIDEVYIYNRPLDQAEIQSLYNNNNPQVLPTNAAVNIASGTLNVGGLSQQIASLAGPGNVQLDNSGNYPGSLILGNANNSTYGGVISDVTGAGSLVKIGSGKLSLEGYNTYGGSTTVSNGTLLVDNHITGSATVASGATLGGLGSIGGAVTVNGSLTAGSNSILGTLTLGSGLTLASGATCVFALSDTNNGNGGVNDQINMSGGALTNNNLSAIIHINALSTGDSLDTNGDYVLINGFGSLSGVFNSTPIWDIQPANYTNYTVVVSGSQVLLHYSATTGPTAGITLSPATVSRNQSTLITVNATNGYYTVTGVTVDVGGINAGASPLTLSQVGSSVVWTNTIAAIASTTPGTYTLTATITDAGSQTISVGANLTVTLANDVWVGGGSDAFFDTNPNWGNSAAPGLVGDSLTFAGIVNTNPSMDLSYTVSGVTFSNNAGMFDITTANGSILTLTANGVVNNSTKTQALEVPLVMGSAQMFNAAAGSLALSQTINNGGYVLTVGGVSNTVVSGAISGSGGITKTNTGTLTLTGSDTFSGNLFAKKGTVVVDTGGSISGINTWVSIGQDGNDYGVLTLKGSGSMAATYFDFNVGDIGSAYGVLNVQDSASLTVSNMFIASANAAGSTACATVNQTGGTVTQLSATTGTFAVGGRTSTNGVAVYNLSGGTLTAASGIRVGGTGTGTFNQNGGMLVANGGINIARIAGSTGTFNENGGTNTTLNIASSTGVNAAFNFNGGTLKPTGNNTTFMTGLTAAYVSTNGAIIDSGGFNITIAQALNAPYYGVVSIAVTNGGSGYVSAPIVSITGGAGYGATAVATVAGGAVTGIIVTSPGGSYNGGDILKATLIGGGGSGAGLNTPVIAAVGSGSLTKNGTGVLTLTGGNSYTGGTVVNGGSLQITGDAQLGTAPVLAATNITLNGGALYNNNSTPVLGVSRTILLGASGGYLQAGWQPQGQSFAVNGLITGTGGLNINWDAAPVYLNAVNNYQGNTTIGTAGPSYYVDNSANSILALGIDNALPYGAGAGIVTFGTSANANTATLNLNGHNAQINGLSGSGNAIVDSTVGGTTNVLTVGRSSGIDTFAGVIKNTAGKVALTKTGGSTLNLTGADTYTGNTTVNGGTLAIAQATLATNSTVTVASGAILILGFATTNTVAGLVTNGVSAGPGVYNSATASPFITGSGSLVVPSSGPGTFLSTPTITSFTINGSDIVVTGINGQSNDAYYLLTSTNVALPVNQWRTVATNVLSSNGSFTFNGTNVVTVGEQQQFYILSNTNYNH